jgi:thymidine phosphorylase
LAQRGEHVVKGQPLAVIHARTRQLATSELANVRDAFSIGATKPRARRVVLERIAR